MPDLFGKLFRVVILFHDDDDSNSCSKIHYAALDENISKVIRRHIIGFRFCDLQV